MRFTWIDKATGAAIEARFDACTDETIESALNITQHPVEKGSDTTDNAHAEPNRISVEGYVSNKPLPSNPGAFGGGAVAASSVALVSMPLDMSQAGTPDATFPISPGALTKVVTSAIGDLLHPAKASKATVFKGVDGFANRAKAMYALLYKAQQDRVLMTVTIMVAELDNMMIGKLAAPRKTSDGNGASFAIELQRVRIVSSATVAAPQAAEARGAPQVAGGSKTAKGPEDDAKNKAKLAGIALEGLKAIGVVGALPPGVPSL